MDNARLWTAEDARDAIAAVHCPTCGKPAAYVALKEYAGSWYVAPIYSCDTDGCEFHIDTDAAWTPDLRG